MTSMCVLHAALVTKLQDAGSKDDIKVPLRILRDEIGRAFFSGCWATLPVSLLL